MSAPFDVNDEVLASRVGSGLYSKLARLEEIEEDAGGCEHSSGGDPGPTVCASCLRRHTEVAVGPLVAAAARLYRATAVRSGDLARRKDVAEIEAARGDLLRAVVVLSDGTDGAAPRKGRLA